MAKGRRKAKPKPKPKPEPVETEADEEFDDLRNEAEADEEFDEDDEVEADEDDEVDEVEADEDDEVDEDEDEDEAVPEVEVEVTTPEQTFCNQVLSGESERYINEMIESKQEQITKLEQEIEDLTFELDGVNEQKRTIKELGIEKAAAMLRHFNTVQAQRYGTKKKSSGGGGGGKRGSKDIDNIIKQAVAALGASASPEDMTKWAVDKGLYAAKYPINLTRAIKRREPYKSQAEA